MNYFINFLTVLANATHLLAANNARLYLLLSAVGLVSGAALWFASNVFGQLFYKPYRLTWGQHCLCGVLAMMMTLCIPLFAASTYLKPSFEAIISVWRDQLSNDRTWQHEQFNRQYYAVKKQGHEDFSHSPPPEQGGKSMPFTHPETIVSTSKMTAEAALENFRQNFPLLAIIINTSADLSAEAVSKDVQAYFKEHPNGTYPHAQGIQLAAAQLYTQLAPQIIRLIWLTRIGITGFIVLNYLLCLLWIGLSALKQIRIHSAHFK
jgi:hypothetical protein